MNSSFLERLKAHGRGGVRAICPDPCGECCLVEEGKPCEYLQENGCSLEEAQRPAVCNAYLCPKRLPTVEAPKGGRTEPPFEPPPHLIHMREAMRRWQDHCVRDVPDGCPAWSTFGKAYLTNIRDHGERSVWDHEWKAERVLVIGGGPSAKIENLVSETMHFLPNMILITRDHLRFWWDEEEEFNNEWWPDDVYVVDGELDMIGMVASYPKDYNRGLICDPCKLIDPAMNFSDVCFVRCKPVGNDDRFTKPQWLGREAPYRTSGELALYIAFYVLKAPVVGVLGAENAEPERHIQYENAMFLLEGGHSSEVIDYSGRGCVHDYLEGKCPDPES